jgi:hypothetical protein
LLINETPVGDRHLPLDSDHQSYLAQVRLFDADQETTRLNEIPLLLDPEPAGPDSAEADSVTCFVVMLSLARFSSA